MIESAQVHADGQTLSCGICIVGGGAAGITLALSLIGKGLDVLLLEAGQEQADAASQSLYEGEVVDERMHSPTDKYRHRGWGGSTTIWGGRCMPFDPIDFEARPQVPLSGWPLSLSDIAPFYPQANAYLEAGHFEYDARDAFDPPAPPLIAGFASPSLSTEGLERFSCPTNMGQRYRARLAVAKDVRVLMGANCTAVHLTNDGTRVDSVAVTTSAGAKLRVTASAFVLAIGGLETARLLLASRDVRPAGVGNAHDVVGRYYMCHLAGNVGRLTISGSPTAVRHGYEVSPDGVYCRRRLQLTPEVQRWLGVSNLIARLHFPKITDPAHRNGVLSGLYLARHFISYEYGKRLNDGHGKGLLHELRHLWNVLTHPADALTFIAHWIRKRTLADRKFPSIILRNRTNRFSLDVHAEQIPLPESRVTLGTQTDALGMPRIKVDWRYSPDDIKMVERTLRRMADEFAASGAARFEFDPATLEDDLTRFGAYGGHHLGTARMGSDPTTSVVDANCRVHDVSNLFIAGGAVFPTSSQANPTLTIVALALRLADHIRHVQSGRSISVDASARV